MKKLLHTMWIRQISSIWIDTDDGAEDFKFNIEGRKKDKPDYTEICRKIKSDAIDFFEESKLIRNIKNRIISGFITSSMIPF